MSDLVPDGWSSSKLSDISKVSIGLVTSMTPFYVNNGVPLIRNSDIKENKIRQSKLINLAPSFSKKHQSRAIKYRDVVTVHTGDIGTSAVVPKELDGCQGFATLNTRVKEEILDPYYLSWFFNTDSYTNFVLSVCTGDGRSNLNLKDFVKSVIVYPPLPEQQKIAKILTSIDEVIEKTQAQIDKLKDLKTGMMQELLTNGIGNNGKPHTQFKDSPVGRVPAEWEVIRVSELVTKVGSGVTPKGGSKAYVSTGIPLIRSQNVHSDGLRLDNVSFITDEQHQKMKGSQLQPNDVLLNITGASIGRCYYLPDNFVEGNVNQHVCIIRLKERIINHVFLTFLLNGQLGQSQIMSLQAGGNREGLNFQQIREIKLPLPTYKEQLKISNAVSSIEDKIQINECKLKVTKNTKKALMQDLLTGKVRVKVEPSA
ncbi:MAG: restriction endonuclease subunit S [Colwellia sp.]|nr:restriction endonuclease subunit S [Colwellia sp.]